MIKYPTGDFQNEVLRAIWIRNGESFATEISGFLKDKLGRELLMPQVQVALKRLEQRRLVELLREDRPSRGGNPRKIYGLTVAGRSHLAANPVTEKEQMGPECGPRQLEVT